MTETAKPTGTDLATPSPVAVQMMTDDEIARTIRVAKALAESGMFKDARTGQQAFAKIVIGRELGMNAAQAMTGLYLVEGKPQVAAPMLGAFVRAQPNCDFTILEHTDEACAIQFWRNGEIEGVSRFTIQDAETAGLLVKDVWKKYPRNMLFARAMSNGVKWFAPEAMGGIPVYVEGEIEPAPTLTSGSGTGEPRGATLPDPVEAVLRRAEQVGHVGLADRATAEMAVVEQPEAVVTEWVEAANAELDAMPVDAVVVEDQPKDQEPSEEQRIEILRETVDELRSDAADAHEKGDEALALDLAARADALEEEARERDEGLDGAEG